MFLPLICLSLLRITHYCLRMVTDTLGSVFLNFCISESLFLHEGVHCMCSHGLWTINVVILFYVTGPNYIVVISKAHFCKCFNWVCGFQWEKRKVERLCQQQWVRFWLPNKAYLMMSELHLLWTDQTCDILVIFDSYPVSTL